MSLLCTYILVTFRSKMTISTPLKHTPFRRYVYFGWLLYTRDIQNRYFLILHNRHMKCTEEIRLKQIRKIIIIQKS